MLARFLASSRTLLRQERELARLREENDQLRAQNQSMRTAMRRCITCDDRRAVMERGVPGAPHSDEATESAPRNDG